MILWIWISITCGLTLEVQRLIIICWLQSLPFYGSAQKDIDPIKLHLTLVGLYIIILHPLYTISSFPNFHSSAQNFFIVPSTFNFSLPPSKSRASPWGFGDLPQFFWNALLYLTTCYIYGRISHPPSTTWGTGSMETAQRAPTSCKEYPVIKCILRNVH